MTSRHFELVGKSKTKTRRKPAARKPKTRKTKTGVSKKTAVRKKSASKSTRKKSKSKKGGRKAFGGYAISFEGRKETAEQIFGKKPIPPSEMTRKLWSFVKSKKLANK